MDAGGEEMSPVSNPLRSRRLILAREGDDRVELVAALLRRVIAINVELDSKLSYDLDSSSYQARSYAMNQLAIRLLRARLPLSAERLADLIDYCVAMFPFAYHVRFSLLLRQARHLAAGRAIDGSLAAAVAGLVDAIEFIPGASGKG